LRRLVEGEWFVVETDNDPRHQKSSPEAPHLALILVDFVSG
jgi:hypothetical protein